MVILKQFWPFAALLLLLSAAPADPPAKPMYLPAGLFPNAARVWLYADDSGIRFAGGKPTLPGTRQLLDSQEADSVRDALVYFDIKAAPPGEYVVAMACIWTPYYVFQFEGTHGEDLGMLVLGKNPLNLEVHPETLVKSGMPLVIRGDGISKVIAHYLRPQQVAAISATRSC